MSEYDVKRALKRREELRDQYARLRRTGKERAARRKQIESEIQKILAEQRAALLVGEREQTNVDLGAFEARVEALRRELEEISAKGQAGKAARQQIEGELERLAASEQPAFAQHASRLAERAAAAVGDLEEGYRTAYALWREADAEWSEFVARHNSRRAGDWTSGPNGQPRIIRPSEKPPKLGTATACPLPDPDRIFGGLRPPQPDGLELVEEPV